MKVLLSAIACDPYGGSELYFGWAAAQCLARDHDLWVITSGRHRASLERAAAEGLIPANVHFIYAGRFEEWHSNRMRARLQSWNEYLSFSRTVLSTARELHRTVRFDLAHHVTYATWRVPSPLWKLGIPFIFGPVGGNEEFPIRFLPMLSLSAAGFELFRILSNVAARLSPAIRACIRHATHVLVANTETKCLAVGMRGSEAGITLLTPAFHSEATIRSFARHATTKNPDGPLRLFAGGNLEGRKGVALALHALAQAKLKGVKFHYRLGGRGSESRHLQNLATRLGLRDAVLFGDPLHGEAYRRELGDTHIFLLPSLRESAGITMMEAMLAGCVPIVADCGGPARIVTDECGYRIPVSNRGNIVIALANTILSIDRNREIIATKGVAATQRIATGFSEAHYRRTINSVYSSVTERSG